MQNNKHDGFERLNSLNRLLLLIAFGLLAYYNAIFHPFVHDDLVFIINNPSISDLSNLASVFSLPKNSQNQLMGINAYYRPLLEIFYRIEYKLFGFHAPGYHFLNIMIHIFNGLLVWKLIRTITGREGIAWCIAAIFMVHPIQTEAVACVSGVSNLLFTAFCLLSFLLYVLGRREKQKDSKVIYCLGSLLCYALSLFVKEQSVILPVLLLLYEGCFYIPIKRFQRSNMVEVALYFFVTLLYFLWRKFVLGGFLVPLLSYSHELVLRITAIPKTLLLYWRLLVVPNDLHYYRSIDILEPIGWAPAGLMVVLGMAGFIVYYIYLVERKESKPTQNFDPQRPPSAYVLVFGIGWFFVAILPMLNFLPLIHEYSFIAAFEHFLYLPLVGFFLFFFVSLDFGIMHLFKEKGKGIEIFLMSLAVFSCMILTQKQNVVWGGEVPLFERTLKHDQRLGRVHVLMGRAYYFQQAYNKAIQEFQAAITIFNGYLDKVEAPTARNFYIGLMKEAHFDLAHCYEGKNNLENSIVHYKEALQLEPNDPVVHNNIGTVYMRMYNLPQAIEHFKEALEINPRDVMSMNNLALCYIEQGNFKDAEQLLRAVLSIDPGDLRAQQNLNILLTNHAHDLQGD